MIVNQQPTAIVNQKNYENKQAVELNQTKQITVNVLNQVGDNVKSYQIQGNPNEELGNQIQSQNQVIEVLVNGKVTSMNTLKEMKFKDVNSVTIMTQAGIGINAQYTLNGKTYSLPSNTNDTITSNSAKIYVPSSILNQGQVTSVTIDGNNYMGKVEGNYVVVNGDIPAVSADSHSVIVNIQNSKGADYGSTTKNTAGVDVVVMNQNGQELSTENIANANGTNLAMVLSKITNPVMSMTYNGSSVSLMQLLTQQYQAGTNNLFVVTVYTQPKIAVNGKIFGRNQYLPTMDSDSVSSAGASISIPKGLLRNFNVNSININGVDYSGSLQGDKYVVNAFIPNAPMYSVMINFARK